MAAKNLSSAVPPSCLDSFNKFKVKIALDLTTTDVRVLKSAIVGTIPNKCLIKIDLKKEGAGLDLLDLFQQFGLFSENNLSLLKEGLHLARRVDLERRLEEFEKTITEVKNLPLSLMNHLSELSDLLYLLITGQSNSIGPSRIHELKESISKKLKMKPSEMPFVCKTEANLHAYAFVVFQFLPKDTGVNQIDQLILAAVNKEEWLVNLGVLQLKIKGKAPICIDENVLEIRPVPPRETRKLEMKDGLEHHCDKALDLILVLEVSCSVTPQVLEQMLKQCQSAIDTLSKGLDMRLAIITYGSHNSSQPTEVAFLTQEFVDKFDFITHVKDGGQHGGEAGGPSGLADALAKAKELAGGPNVRKEATKLCILINFLGQDIKNVNDLEYYRCSHGNDAIQLCGELANAYVTSYIFGVKGSLPQQGNVTLKETNYFLEGLAHIGGGRYFQLEDVKHLDQAITSVTRHDISIEKQGKAIGEMVKEDIIIHHGVTRFNGLPKDLEQKLASNGTKVDILEENGKSLKRVSKQAEKVAMSDDLDDLIKSLRPGYSKRDSRSRSCKAPRLDARGATEVGEPSGISKVEPFPAIREKELDQKCSISLVENHCVDFECAVRIMRRQLHRLAYFEIPDPEDEEMMQVDN